MTSVLTNQTWNLTNVYGPCNGLDRMEFTQWFEAIKMEVEDLWLFMGDFNFMGSLDNRNQAGGNIDDIIKLNEIAISLALLEMAIKGRQYTWSNMQQNHY